MSTSLSKVTSHELAGLGLMVEQFKEATNFRELIGSYLRQAQEVEDSLWAVLLMTMANAEGDQLDEVYGNLVGIERNGRTDADYRIALQAQISINRSSGTYDELLRLARLLVDSSSVLTLTEHYPAAIEIRAATVSHETTGETIAAKLREAKAAGVRLIFIYQATTDENVFTWDSTTSTQEWDGGEWATGTDGA